MIILFFSHIIVYRKLHRDTDWETSYKNDMEYNWKNMFVIGAPVVEVFFVIKGIVMTRSTMKSMKE